MIELIIVRKNARIITLHRANGSTRISLGANHAFFGNSCFERHRAERFYNEKSFASVCESVRICNDYGRFVKSNSRHECDVIFCKTCFPLLSVNHSCFMQLLWHKIAIKNPGESTSATVMQEEVRASESEIIRENSHRKDCVAFVFYDFKTRQDKTLEGTENVKIHIPTLSVAQQMRNKMRGNRRYVGAMLLVRSTQIYISAWSGKTIWWFCNANNEMFQTDYLYRA